MNKKQIFFLICFIVCKIIQSQTYIICDNKSACTWNKNTEKYDVCQTGKQKSLLILNSDEKSFIFFADSTKSVFTILGKTYNEIEKANVYHIVSDNLAYFIGTFDFEHHEIRLFVATKKDAKPEDAFLIKYNIEQRWKDK